MKHRNEPAMGNQNTLPNRYQRCTFLQLTFFEIWPFIFPLFPTLQKSVHCVPKTKFSEQFFERKKKDDVF